MHFITSIRACSLLCLVVGTAFATEPQPPVASPAPPEAVVVTPDLEVNADAPAPVRSPLMLEIDAALAEQSRQLAELEAQTTGAADDAAANEIQRQIEVVKTQTEIDILAIQARYARAAGREELALEIEAGIAQLQSPPPPPPNPAVDR